MEEQRSRSTHLTGLLLAVVAGLALGALAKIADQSSIHELSQIGTQLGLWVVVLTITSVTAPSRPMAALRGTLLMTAMVFAYYAATYLYFRVISPLDIVVWGLLAVTGVPVIAMLLQPARGDGLPAALATALPVGLLAAEAFGFRYRVTLYAAPLVFDSVALALLLWVLPRNNAMRIKAAALAVPFGFLGHWMMTDGFGIVVGYLRRGFG